MYLSLGTPGDGSNDEYPTFYAIARARIVLAVLALADLLLHRPEKAPVASAANPHANEVD